MGTRKPVKTNDDMDDGVYERPPQNDADPFGHNSRGKDIKKSPVQPRVTSEIERVDRIDHEAEHPGVAASRKTLAEVVAGKHDDKAF